MKKFIATLVTAVMAMSLFASVGFATVVQTTDLYSQDGTITVTQYGRSDVAFVNNLKMDSGRLTFSQNIDTSYGHFDNDVMLHGDDLRIKNTAFEQSVPTHWAPGIGQIPTYNQIVFKQNVYMGESSYDWDAAKSTQIFYNGDKSKHIAEEIQAQPTSISGTEVEYDTMNIWDNVKIINPDGTVTYNGPSTQSGFINSINPRDANKAGLTQIAKLHADYDFAKQWSNIGGSIGSIIESYNNPNWVKFAQTITWQ